MATLEPFTIYLGFDSREAVASEVLCSSIVRQTKHSVKFHYLKHRDLRKRGLFKRPWIIEGESGEFRDLLDDKPFSTEFSHTRFLIPELQSFRGWALFLDADMIAQCDIANLLTLKRDQYAIMCVKHQHNILTDTSKMDGRVQQKYFRKNWSSFVLWNCAHPSNKRITKEKVSFMPGRDLHAFTWLQDHEIGSLPYTYNYISGVSPKLPVYEGGPTKADIIHYTEGGPWFANCKSVPYAHLWDEEYRIWQDNGAPSYDNYLHKVEI